MDELMGEPWPERGTSRIGAGFSPRVDVFYTGRESPVAVVLVELAGIDSESLNLEVAGRDLVISGERLVQQPDGRVYQQVEIETGSFRRVIELSANVDAERAEASYVNGILRIELPLKATISKRVPVEPKNSEHAD